MDCPVLPFHNTILLRLFGSEVIFVLPNRYNNLGISGNILEKWKREKAFKVMHMLERVESRKRDVKER